MLTVPLGFLFALGMFAAGFAIFIIEERSSGLFHLQLIGGLKRPVYWLSLFTWDFIMLLLFIVAIVASLAIFQDYYFSNGKLYMYSKHVHVMYMLLWQHEHMYMYIFTVYMYTHTVYVQCV